ncbi:MAG: replicative helicase loader/inhibitor [Desulfotomaculaceae bacterium]|nr:replicative helicase loader/inhibitor [Desulfotomaculaceae bacterium]
MTKAEVAKLLAFITATYPNIEIRQGTVEAWHEMLGDLPYHSARVAVKKVLAEQEIPYLPAIGKIRVAVAELTNPRIASAAEAWGEVVQAIRRYGYYREKQALASLSPATAQVVKWLGWQELCTCEEVDVIRGQFRRAYDEHAGNVRQEAVLPAGIRELISSGVKTLPGVN